ncbi:MAG: TatD family hydrolase [Balneolaceae bacterium]|nr:TatD family hydrolase [Balneolaceae bacterium]
MSFDDMMFIDPHVHMISRTTDDYEAMRRGGVVALIEPAFWIGQPRTNAGSMLDYFSMIVGWERFRAKQFGIQHYCTIGLNAKEANNQELAEKTMDLIPRYASKEGVVAIGEIGYDDMTELEEHYFHEQLELAKKMNMLVLVHTPHRNKKQGTIRSMDLCEEHGLEPSKVIIDHNNEETVEDVLDRGTGPHLQFIPAPRWATNGWWRSSRNMALNAFSLTARQTGDEVIHLEFPKLPN